MKRKMMLFLLVFGVLSSNIVLAHTDVSTSETPVSIVLENEKVETEDIFAFTVQTGVGQVCKITNLIVAKMPDETNKAIWGVSINKMIFVALMIMIAFILKKIIIWLFQMKAKKDTSLEKLYFLGPILEATGKPLGLIAFLMVIHIMIEVLTTGNSVQEIKMIMNIFGAFYLIVLAWYLLRLCDVVSCYIVKCISKANSEFDTEILPFINKSLKVVVLIIFILTLLGTLGFNITAILSGLGIGALAIALALQDTLANLFGSIFIIFDRPFKIGDHIIADGAEGTVEELGFRTTKVRTLDLRLVSIPNKIVAAQKLTNISVCPRRKVVQTLGVTYSTTTAQMQQLCLELKAIIDNDEGVYDGFKLVKFTEFGSSSLDILVVYFTDTKDFVEYSEIKERINIKFMNKVEELGLSFAFPSRSIYMEKND